MTVERSLVGKIPGVALFRRLLALRGIRYGSAGKEVWPADCQAPCDRSNRMAWPALRALPIAFVLLASLYPGHATDVHQGCFRSYDYGERPLVFQATTGSTMTPALCEAMAKRRFATAYGLEYGVECWLDSEGKSLDELTSLGPNSSCLFPCAGDRSEKCGGSFAMNLYTTGPVEVKLDLPEGGWTGVGCYRDSHWFRYMPKQLWKSRTNMTTELCAHIAYSEHWPVFALQYGNECWGADDIHLAAGGGNSTLGCDMPCPGNDTQSCGGSWSLQVYQFNTPPAVDTTHAGTTPPAAPYDPTITPETIGGSSGGLDGQMGTLPVDSAASLLLGGGLAANTSGGQVIGEPSGADRSGASGVGVSGVLSTVVTVTLLFVSNVLFDDAM